MKREMSLARMMRVVSLLSLIILACFASSLAQVASGGSYTLDQAAIASGGGNNSTGGTFALDGTTGQPIAGTRSTNSPFAVTGGFWTAAPLAPTAAGVLIGGRVFTPAGRGLRNARVTLTDGSGGTRTVLTGVSGYYRFADVSAGETYIINVVSKRYTFAPQVVNVTEDVADLNFTAVQ